MASIDPITASLMAPGAEYEAVEAKVDGRSIRTFKNAPDNLPGIFDGSREFGEAEFVVSGDTRLSYNEFFKRADALSGWLIESAKINPGQSVAICMQNSPEWLIAFVAIVNAGGVAVLVNSRGKPEILVGAIEDADSVLVITDGRRLGLIRDGGCKLPMVTTGEVKDGATAFYDAVGKAEVLTGRESSPEDLAAMFFTSGTTGRPKAAALTHRNLFTAVISTQMSMTAAFTAMAQKYNITVEQFRAQIPQSVTLLVFPLFHTSGCTSLFLTPFASGGKLVMQNRWDADAALALIEKEKVSIFAGVPAMFWDMLNADTFAKADKSSLVSVAAGGQALPQRLLSAILEGFPGVIMGGGYGMTETTGAIAQANGQAFVSNPRGSGCVLPLIDVQIVDENEEPTVTGKPGEIWVKGATLMQGYYGRPEDTANSMSGDWFKTGDIGHLDEDGVIYIVDRKTDMVISGGENIYCAEVEQALSDHVHILEIAAFGIPDARLGERLVASVVIKDPGCTPADIIEYAKTKMPGYQVPTDVSIMTTPFERNAMGKILKKKIREAYLSVMK